MARKPSDIVQLKLRFEEKLRRRLQADAAKNERSLNAEIIDRLERSYSTPNLAQMTATAVVEELRIAGVVSPKKPKGGES